MKWNDHSTDVAEGSHAFLGASKHAWLNYDEEKLKRVYINMKAVEAGTKTHEFAALCIRRGQTLPKTKATLNQYVNDAIGFKMTPELVLFYSYNCFGTADAISFKTHPKKKQTGFNYFLRIHDLKTGQTPASLHQLEIYAALFFLEYDIKPEETEIELRIYQNDDILIGNPTANDITPIMEKIVRFDKLLDKIDAEG